MNTDFRTFSREVEGKKFEVIDTDPHFTRVVKYFRPSDYAILAGVPTLGTVGLTYWEKISPRMVRPSLFAQPYYTVAFLVLSASGFNIAYRRSCDRFLGWTENSREAKMDMEELTERGKKKLPLYGYSALTPQEQRTAAKNSTNSQILLNIIPFFNVVNHKYHGVDPLKYGVTHEEYMKSNYRPWGWFVPISEKKKQDLEYDKAAWGGVAPPNWDLSDSSKGNIWADQEEAKV